MLICENSGCTNDAEFYDAMDNKICQECMERDIEENGCWPEDFEKIPDEDHR